MVATLLILLLLLVQANAHDLDGSVYCSRDGETRRVSDFGAVTPVWSPDGEMICYVQHTHDGDLFYFISATGEQLQTVPLPSPLTVTAGVSWHPNGGVTFAAASQGGSYDIYNWTRKDRPGSSCRMGFSRPGRPMDSCWLSLRIGTATWRYTLRTMRDACET